MSGYYDIYRKRLNRYGTDYQSRVQNQREREFDDYLKKSVYRVDFDFEGEMCPATLEPYKQDYTQTQAYLLTKIETKLPSGLIVFIKSKDGTETPWLVWWLEHMEASGYNRYVVLKTNYQLDLGGRTQWGYFVGPGTSAVSDTMKSATGYPVYNENNNLYRFITPYSAALVKDLYFEVTYKEMPAGFVIKEVDIHSTLGVAYVTVDPVPVREAAEEVGEPATPEENQDYFWLNGGNV